MRVQAVLLGFLTLALSTNAQYFSQGWQPGQAVPTESSSAPAPTYTPGPREPPKPLLERIKSLFDADKILESAPISGLLEKAGVNITERIQKVKEEQAKLWDTRIPFISDDNYVEMIVNETLTEQEEEDRVWFLVITVTSAQQNGISKLVDAAFDSAYQIAQDRGDLPDVRWGRIDYLNVTALTTKWVVWQAPYLVVLKDRGQTLRFYRTHQIRISDDLMYNFLKEKGYEHTPPWKTSFAPGGSREWIMDYYAQALTKFYNTVIIIPKWLVYIMTGGIGSLIIGLLHGKPKTNPAPARREAKPVAEASPKPSITPDTKITSTPSKKDRGKQRKGKK